jgi:hypothetical protein
MVDADAAARVGLRVEVDQQHLVAFLGQRRGQVDGRRRLAHAALLVDHRDHPWANRLARDLGFGFG